MSTHDFSLVNLIREYNNNKELIQAYFSGDVIEAYKDTRILGLDTGVFVVLVVIATVLWLWALIALIVFADRLVIPIIVISALFLLPLIPFGSIISLCFIYLTKSSKKIKR
mgnify:CR=1 FL=1